MDSYRICDECYKSFFYADSPATDKCFCGASLREVTEEEYVMIINRRTDTNYPTVSC